VETAAATGRATPHGHAALERVVVPVRLALLRLRRRSLQALAAALGIAVGAAVLALTVVGSAAVQDRALQQALARLEPSDRAIEAVWSGVPAQSNLSFPRLDADARAQTASILGHPPFRVVVFRQATWGGAFVNLGAVDGLRRWITLKRGRLPRRCTPTDCELVQIGGAPAQPKLPFLHVVGRAAFTAGAPLQAYFGAGNGKGPPILLADGVLPFVRTPLPDAALIARTYGWIVPVAPRRVHDWQLASLDDRLNRAQSALERASDIFTIAAPTDTIAGARATSRVAAQRLLILGGDAAVLLLGFAVLASTRLRRDHAEVRRRLTWSGARGSQLLLVAVTEVVGLTGVATVVGWTAGSGAGALLSRHLGSPGGAVVAHSILTTRTLGLALGLGAVTAATMLVALRADELALGGLRITAADAAALGALAAVLLALARGKADTSTLQHSGTGVVLLLLPALVLFVLAVASARLLGPLLRAVERLARRSPPMFRVAILSLARSPGDVALTVVFFVLSVGIAVFAFAYRATLLQGERQQALYAVPAPYVLSEDLTKLVTVEQALPRGGGTPVLRDSGYTTGTAARDFTLLALPPRALAAIGGWRTDFSSQSPAQLASLLRPPSTPRLRTILRLAAAPAATLRFTTTGDMVGVSAVVADRRGDFTTLLLGEHRAGRHAATVRVPPEARGGRIVAFRVSFPVTASYVAAHRAAETSHTVNDASVGSIRFDGWPGTHRFVVNNGADAILRPREPLEGQPVPVVASPALAAAADASGIVPLHVENETVAARIVATARYFPSVDGDLVVADLGTWIAAANTADPGTTAPSELWRTTAPPSGTPLAVASQRATEQSLSDDPLARGAIALLLVTAVVGLVLAAVGVLLTVLGDLRDERGALFDLSAQGSTPSDLRCHLLVRAAAVASLGLVAGVAAGAIVAALVVAVVTVSAGAQQALPPLLLSFDWPLAVAALVAVAVAAAGSAAVAVRRLR
jgi:hypothetical protein